MYIYISRDEIESKYICGSTNTRYFLISNFWRNAGFFLFDLIHLFNDISTSHGLFKAEI